MGIDTSIDKYIILNVPVGTSLHDAITEKNNEMLLEFGYKFVYKTTPWAHSDGSSDIGLGYVYVGT